MVADKYQTFPVICTGGFFSDPDPLVVGNSNTGAARNLINYEPLQTSGYRKILGFEKYNESVVPGTGTILGVFPFNDKVIACRGESIYYGTSTSWGSAINSVARATTGKYRFTEYTIGVKKVCMTNGVNPALLWDGATDTVVNSTGAPTAPKLSAYHLDRLVLSQDNKIYLSAPLADTDFTALSGAIQINVPFSITGLKRFREILYIFTQGAIYKLVGNSANNFQLLSVTDKVGCISPDTIQEIGGDVIYLSSDSLRSLAATERNDDLALSSVSQQITAYIQSYIRSVAEDNYSSVVIPNKSQYRLFFLRSVGSQISGEGLLATLQSGQNLNYQYGKLDGFNVAAAGDNFTATGESLAVFGHPSNGFVYKMESGSSFDGQDITCVLEFPLLTLGDARIRKRFQKMEVFLGISQNTTFTASYKVNASLEKTIQPSARTISLGQGIINFWNQVTWNNFSWGGGDNYLSRVVLLNGTGQQLDMSFLESSKNLPHTFYSMQLEFIAEGKR